LQLTVHFVPFKCQVILCGHTILACAPQQKFFQPTFQLQTPRPTTRSPYFQRSSSSSSWLNPSPNYLKLLFGQQWGNKNLFGSAVGAVGSTSSNRNFLPSSSYNKPQSLTQLFTVPSPTTSSALLPATSPAITFRAQPHKPNCPSTTPSQNKNLVVLFYQRTLGDKNLSNLEQYLLPSYIQHNPGVPDGIDGFITLFTTGALKGQPPIKVDFQRVSAENDLVWIHSRLPLQNPSRVFSVVDIFRVECGKIAEHWDVLQQITPEILQNARNSHPFF